MVRLSSDLNRVLQKIFDLRLDGREIRKNAQTILDFGIMS